MKRKDKDPGIEARLEHLYAYKALTERLFGNPAFMKIKMGGSMRNWRASAIHLLDAIDLSIRSTVKIADSEWFSDIQDELDWPAPGSEDTELGVLMELEVDHGTTEVYAGVQA